MTITKEQRYRLSHPDRARAIRAKWRSKNLTSWAEYFLRWRQKDPPHAIAIHLWHNAKRRAKEAGLPFEIEVPDIESRIREGTCSVTGLPLDLSVGTGKKAWAPSIDRINPQLGYVTGNWRMVVFLYNVAKNRFSDADVLKLAEAIVRRGAPLHVGQPCVHRIAEHRAPSGISESLGVDFDAHNGRTLQLGDVDARMDSIGGSGNMVSISVLADPIQRR